MSEEDSPAKRVRYIDFAQFPDGAISGLTEQQIDQALDQLEVNKLLDDGTAGPDVDFLDALFSKLPTEETQLEELEQIVSEMEGNATCKSVVRATDYWMQRLRRFLGVHSSLPQDLSVASPNELDRILRFFYGTLRKKDGGLYAPATLVCIRAAIHRHFMTTRRINILVGDEFLQSNRTLKAMARTFIAAGGRPGHYQAIETTDLERLSRYFDRSSPESLQHEVFYNIVYYFGNRGREWCRALSEESFRFEIDSDGCDVVHFVAGKIKNVGNDLTRDSCEDVKEAIMSALPDRSICPVEALKLYMRKRGESIPGSSSGTPKPAAFFLQPKLTSWQSSSWYYASKPVGVNTLGQMMTTISKKASLSKTYTAHCIRSTVVKELANAGYSVPDICKVTGHKQTRTVDRYLRFGSRRDAEMRSMSKSLSSALHGPEKRPAVHSGQQVIQARQAATAVMGTTPSTGVVVQAVQQAATIEVATMVSQSLNINEVDNADSPESRRPSVVYHFHGPLYNCNFHG